MKSKNIKKEFISVSIVMPVYNAEKYISESIDSIICQSFRDFECIIVDDGSTDNTRNIIRSYKDNRIRLIENEHSFINSLNLGLSSARGKYIARMDADDIMHPDRLKIQYAIMEAEPSITICSTWMKIFGDNISTGNIPTSFTGLVEYPLIAFLKGNFVFHSTIMIQRSFLIEKKLRYENYPYAEDMKLWTEVAKCGGIFYVENQILLYYRISETQVSQQKREDQRSTAERISLEIVNYLLDKNKDYPELALSYESLKKLQEKDLITLNGILEILQKIFYKNKNKLHLV
jgi:glycosyltransferase involved in cell wall biosynthesis